MFLIVFPFVGVLVYLIANHDGMNERNLEQAKASRAEFDDYVKSVAGEGGGGGGGAASEIEKAKALLDRGTINQAEFDALKAKALA